MASARAATNRTEGLDATASAGSSGLGTGNDSTGMTTSVRAWSATRLVRSTRTWGQAARTASTKRPTWSMARAPLSRTRRMCRSRRMDRSSTSGARKPANGTPMALAAAVARSVASVISARSTTTADTGERAPGDSTARQATSRANRLLPMPPGPVTVTSRRPSAKARSMAVSSDARPNSGVAGRASFREDTGLLMVIAERSEICSARATVSASGDSPNPARRPSRNSS